MPALRAPLRHPGSVAGNAARCTLVAAQSRPGDRLALSFTDRSRRVVTVTMRADDLAYDLAAATAATALRLAAQLLDAQEVTL